MRVAPQLRVPVEGADRLQEEHVGEGEVVSRGGVVVDRVIACPGIGAGRAADSLMSVVVATGDYHAVRVASDRVQFARTFRPTWATVVGFCLLPVALIGIVFFFVKTTETCIAVVEADHRGTRIRLSGRLESAVLNELVGTFDDPAGAARELLSPVPSGLPSPLRRLRRNSSARCRRASCRPVLCRRRQVPFWRHRWLLRRRSRCRRRQALRSWG